LLITFWANTDKINAHYGTQSGNNGLQVDANFGKRQSKQADEKHTQFKLRGHVKEAPKIVLLKNKTQNLG